MMKEDIVDFYYRIIFLRGKILIDFVIMIYVKKIGVSKEKFNSIARSYCETYTSYLVYD